MSGEYDWLTLDDDEEILWDGEISQKSMIGTYVVGIPLILLLGLGLLIIVPSYLIVKHTDYVITSKGVYKKTGILSRSVTEIEYEKIQNTAFSAGPVARYFRYGDVDISTAGGSGVEMKLRAVDDPRVSRSASRGSSSAHRGLAARRTRRRRTTMSSTRFWSNSGRSASWSKHAGAMAAGRLTAPDGRTAPDDR